jgi:S-formylglutathione hydrolase FrmB
VKRLLIALAAVLTVGLAALTTPVSAPARAATPPVAPPPVSWSDGQGLHVVSAQPDGDPLWRLVVSTAALSRPVRVNVLLPTGYDGRTRYPVLFLFHGTSGGADDWLDSGDVAAATAAYPMIVVMPDAGYDGNGGSWFTDWVDQGTSLGAARWETFHIDQLVPYVDAHLRTVHTRSGRAVAGLSQGGFGSLSYAARHPDLFVAAAGFSPAPDIWRDPRARVAGTALVAAIAGGLDGVQPNAPFGDPLTHGLTWAGHNPASLVTNLGDTDVALWGGNGIPGPFDTPAGLQALPQAAAVEVATHESTTYFTQAAQHDGVAVTFTDYGPGTHIWPYWARDLKEYLPRLQQVFDEHRPRPRRIDFKATEDGWSRWGWRVRNTAGPGWTGLQHAGRRGFTFSGRSAVVTTPERYRPRRAYAVTWRRGSGPTVVRADRRGRLVLAVTADRGVAQVTLKRVRAAAGAGAAPSR